MIVTFKPFVACRCGSLYVELVLKFKNVVEEDWELSIFRSNAKNGKFLRTSSLVEISPVINSTDTPLTSKSTPQSNGVFPF